MVRYLYLSVGHYKIPKHLLSLSFEHLIPLRNVLQTNIHLQGINTTPELNSQT